MTFIAATLSGTEREISRNNLQKHAQTNEKLGAGPDGGSSKLDSGARYYQPGGCRIAMWVTSQPRDGISKIKITMMIDGVLFSSSRRKLHAGNQWP